MLASWKKIYDKPRQHIKKQRHHFADKGLYSHSYGFSGSMCEYESWTIRKAEHQRIATSGLWCWRRFLRVPWTARSDQSILKETNPEYSLEGRCWSWSSNTLATWWEKLTHWKRPWSWERLRARGEGDNRGWDGWMASLTQWMWVCTNSGR